MRPRCRRVVGLLAVTALACGGGDRVTAPTPVASPSPLGVAAGSVVTVIRGDTGTPVEGAAVTVAGRTYVADAAGTVRIADAAPPGALVDVTDPSVLDRQTTVANGPLGTLVLWPRSSASGIDETFTATVVYTRVGALTGTGPLGAELLRRLARGVPLVVVVPTPDILADDMAHAAHAASVARMNAAARGTVTYALARDRPASGTVFVARVGPDDPSCGERVLAFTRATVRGQEITGGEIVYCSRDAPRRAALVVHEMGHTFGLWHSADSRDMMFGALIRSHAEEFRPREADVMALMMQRRAGNRFPDSDRGVAGASVREDVIVCR